MKIISKLLNTFKKYKKEGERMILELHWAYWLILIYSIVSVPFVLWIVWDTNKILRRIKRTQRKNRPFWWNWD